MTELMPSGCCVGNREYHDAFGLLFNQTTRFSERVEVRGTGCVDGFKQAGIQIPPRTFLAVLDFPPFS